MSSGRPVVGCVLVAAGSGTRLGLGIPKALADAGPATLLGLAVAGVAAVDPATGTRTVQHLVVVVPAAEQDACTALVRRAWAGADDAAGLAGLAAAAAAGTLAVVPGGADRQASVSAGLDALPATVEVVLVHDAARALTPPSLLVDVAAAVRGAVVAVVPGITPADTVKRLAPPRPQAGGAADGSPGTPGTPGTRTVAETLDRSALVAVQTPQGFRADVIRGLHRAARGAGRPAIGAGMDDAGMAEAAGHPVVVVPGHPEAFKVTTALDLVLARALLAERASRQDVTRDS